MNKEYIASFDVDAQRGFTVHCPDELPVEGGHLIVSELNANADIAGYRIGSKDAHPPNPVWEAHTPEDIMTPVDGVKNVDMLPGLPHPQDYDYFVWKGIERDMHPYGACFHDLSNKISTGVIEWLEYENITTVLVGGLATDYCVKNTVIQLKLFTNCHIFLNKGACAGVDHDSTYDAMKEMHEAGVHICEDAAEIKIRLEQDETDNESA